MLEKGKSSPLLFEDPNGNSALSHAKIQKRVIRQMRRANLPFDDVVRETIHHQAPRPRDATSSMRPPLPSPNGDDRSS